MNEAFELANANNNDTDISDSDTDDQNKDSDESDNDDDNDDTNGDEYTLSKGNAGLVLVNQIIDYIHRGDELSDMCLYEYCEKVYKSVIKEDDIKKNESAKKLRAHKESNLGRYRFYKKKKGRLPQPKYN